MGWTGKTAQQRFLEKVEIPNDPNQCWKWTASRREALRPGFKAGQFYMNGKITTAHRASYEIFYGVKPELDVCHHCDNHECVNPAHLYQATAFQNMQDSVKRGRNFNKQKTHCSKGHEFSKENTHFIKNQRLCKTCNRIRSNQSYYRSKAKNIIKAS